MLVPLAIFLIGFGGTLALVPLLDTRGTHTHRTNLLIGAAIVFGYVVGGTVLWWFVPPDWHMSFWDTLAASVDAETYGHRVEHYAECILVWILCACVAGAVVSGVLAATAARLLKRPRHA